MILCVLSTTECVGNGGRLMQKILRELLVVELVVSLLTLPFQKGLSVDEVKTDAQLLKLVNLMYRLLKQMAKNNLANARVMLQHLPVFRYLLHTSVYLVVYPTWAQDFQTVPIGFRV